MQSIQSSLDERLIRQAKRLAALTQTLRQSLPVECEGHYHVANIRRQSLVVITDSPVWTTRLRQLAPDILRALQQCGIDGVQHVDVVTRVRYKAPERKVAPRVERTMSESSADIIDSTAEYISDEGLSSALKKLAKRAKQ